MYEVNQLAWSTSAFTRSLLLGIDYNSAGFHDVLYFTIKRFPCHLALISPKSQLDLSP